MSVVLQAKCDRCSSTYTPDRQVTSFSPGAVRARAAFHGWAQREWHGVVVDLCPACLQEAIPVPQRTVERVLVGTAPAAPRSPAAPVHRTVLDVEVCERCADGEHQWCRGCDCRTCS